MIYYIVHIYCYTIQILVPKLYYTVKNVCTYTVNKYIFQIYFTICILQLS